MNAGRDTNTMIDVMVVDDEPIIRVGLRTLIEWEKHGFRLVGEASDGEEALGMMSEQSVDLLVTDIRMPRMDGLELIRQTKQRNEHIGIVVLSCLDDFAFVKEAMKLGAKDYILKPTMEPDELVDILKTISQGLYEERQERARITELNLRLEQSRPYRLQAKLLRYIEQGKADSDLSAELFVEGKKLYTMLVCLPPGSPIAIHDDELQGTIVAVRLPDNQLLLLMDCDRHISVNEWYQQAYNTSEKLLRQWSKSGSDGAAASGKPIMFVGKPIQELGELPKRIEYHRLQVHARYYGKGDQRIYMDEPLAELCATDAGMPTLARNHLLRAVSGSNQEAIRYYLNETTALIGETKPDLAKLHGFIFETMSLMIGYARESNYRGLTELEQQYLSLETIASWISYKDLCAFLTAFVRDMFGNQGRLKASTEMNKHPFIRKAVAYIRDNYGNNIGTADIAEHVKLSRSYLSDLYSKETGESLTETLTNVRIEEACKLLLSTDKKIYEIAEAVGFNDSKTFTKTFKRILGCSPKEYLASNK
jgi:two-component system, response regulator YesN